MSESGKVTGREIKKNKDGLKNVIVLQVEITDPDDIQSIELINHSGEDNNPPNGSRVIIVKTGEANKYAIASDDNIEPITNPGEKRIYSTDEDNTAVNSQVYLKNDGTIIASNDEITITAEPGGKLTIVTTLNTEITSAKTIINNDVDIIGDVDITGNLTVSGFITAIGNITGATIRGLIDLIFVSKSVKNHTHSQGNDSDGDSEQNTSAPV